MNTFQPLSFFTVLVVAAITVAPAPLHAQESASAGAGDPAPARWQTSHSMVIGGETVEYDAVVTGTTLTNDDGEPAAELWYTAYFRTNGAPSPERPIVFSFNGGAGFGVLLAAHGNHGAAPGGHPGGRSAGCASLPAGGQCVHDPGHRGHRDG